jgi:uncharacterized protein YbjT (DUF2867 family)
MILVTGASGNVGGELVRALAELGEPVRVVVRSEGGRHWPAGTSAFVADLDRPETLAPALAGARGVFLMSGYPGVLSVIRAAGVEQVVLLSGGAAVATNVTNPVSRYMIETENATRESGVRWTILRPHAFMSNTQRWAPQLAAGDVVRVPFASISVSSIDPFDIAAVAAQALTSDQHGGQTYRLSGPESITPADQVRVLAGVLGRELRLEPASDADAKAELRASMPSDYADALFGFSTGETLDESRVLPTVQEVTGQLPRAFDAWAAAHADAFGAA